MVREADWVSGLVTVRVTAPAVRAGVVAVMVVAEVTVTAVAAVPPRVTVAPVVNPVPVMVMAVPPARGPVVGVKRPRFDAASL